MNRKNTPVQYASGQIVWVRLFNAVEHPGAAGKWRPALLIHREGSQWITMGLTTRPTYRCGTGRVAVPNPKAVGLPGPGFVWGDRTARISVLDLGDHIGWVDHALGHLVASMTSLPESDVAALAAAAEEHHGHGQSFF